ncbi:hypothetical protein N7533_011477 [Penicillium manginii]|uniref:uncharacterized protein n=1 Tax=Penicillium manginii TaxID=203109 RepID=UPI00254977BD|nr:uncharacterized protein N7533_011477 [Penicillium manginii]KAJ5742068.1 hypothetical protein N7533_011477 [Penicillium manginii]
MALSLEKLPAFGFELTEKMEYISQSFLIEFVTKTLTVVGDKVDSAMHVPAPEGHPFSHALVVKTSDMDPEDLQELLADAWARTQVPAGDKEGSLPEVYINVSEAFPNE